METVDVARFKGTCLQLLRKVKRTGQPILITRRGEPIAQIMPPPRKRPKGWLGWGKGTMRILGDIVSPVMEENDWEAAR